MPVAISVGVPFVMTQNTRYACPVSRCVGYVSPATAVLQGNTVDSATGMVAITVAAEGTFTANPGFIRCTDVAGATVLFKA